MHLYHIGILLYLWDFVLEPCAHSVQDIVADHHWALPHCDEYMVDIQVLQAGWDALCESIAPNELSTVHKRRRLLELLNHGQTHPRQLFRWNQPIKHQQRRHR